MYTKRFLFSEKLCQATASNQAVRSSQAQIRSGHLAFRHMAAEHLLMDIIDELYDVAFAVRVGGLDGRHPAIPALALPKIARALKPRGKLYIDGGNPLLEISLTSGGE